MFAITMNQSVERFAACTVLSYSSRNVSALLLIYSPDWKEEINDEHVFSIRQSVPTHQYKFINVNTCFFVVAVVVFCLGYIPFIQTNTSRVIIACFQIIITYFAPGLF